MDIRVIPESVIKLAQSLNPLPEGFRLVQGDDLAQFASPYTWTKDAYLTDYYIKYPSGPFVADIVAPRVPVKKLSGYIGVFGKSNMRRVKTQSGPTGAGGPDDHPKLVVLDKGTDQSYKCVRYALGMELTEDMIENADIKVLREAATQWIRDLIGLDRELRVATPITTLANWSANCRETLSGNDQWSDYTNSEPLTKIKDAKVAMYQNGGGRATHIVLPSDVRDTLAMHPQIKNLTNQSSDRRPNLDLPKTILDMEVVEADGLYITDHQGQGSDTYSSIWGKHATLLNVPASKTMFQQYVMATYAYGQAAVKRVFDEIGGGGVGSERIYVVEQAIDEVMESSAVHGYLFRDAIA